MIYLAGPAPRETDKLPWHPEAINALHAQGFEGAVIVPQSLNERATLEADEQQLSWEFQAQCLANVLLFWVPRNPIDMLGLTTNLEWGMWYSTGKVVIGIPPEATMTLPMRHAAHRAGIKVCDTLDGTVRRALQALASPNTR